MQKDSCQLSESVDMWFWPIVSAGKCRFAFRLLLWAEISLCAVIEGIREVK